MKTYEYKVIPAPVKGTKAKGAKTAPARFALTLTNLMNELGREGWEYLRADTLPVEQRQGLTGKTTNFQNMLVFRRELPEAITPDETALPVPDAVNDDRPASVAADAAARISASLSTSAPEGRAAPVAVPTGRPNGPMLGLARRIAGKPYPEDGMATD